MPLIFTNARKSTLSLQSFFRGATGAPGAGTTLYDTRTQAAAATIDSAANFVQTEGYTTVGDGGGALYIHDSGPSTGGFQSADGAYWKLTDQVFNVKMFGALGDNSTNDATAVTAAFAVAAARKLPLLVIGGGTFLVDSVPLVSNLTLLGDNNTTIKLKNSTAGSMFVWPTSTTTDNVTIRDLLLDGNIINQPGAPHNVIHSIFYGANGTCHITNSRFSGLSAKEIDGCLFGGATTGDYATYTDCVFRDIKVVHHTQTAIAIVSTRCLLERIYIDNAVNTQVRTLCYGITANAIDCTLRTIRVLLSPTVIADKVGIDLSAGTAIALSLRNTLDDIEVDCGGADHNFGYTIDTGDHTTMVNCRSRNCVYNTDFELLTQTSFTATNLIVENNSATGAAFGIVLRDSSEVNISGYSFASTTGAQDNVVFQNTCTNVAFSNFNTNGGAAAIRLDCTGTNLAFSNGVIRNAGQSGGQWQLKTGTNVNTNLSFNNILMRTCWAPWHFQNVANLTLANITGESFSNDSIGKFLSCSNVRMSNLEGITFTRFTESSKQYGITGDYEGQLYGYYSFTVSGGGLGAITLGESIPANATVRDFSYFVTTGLASATTTAVVSLGTSSNPTLFLPATIISNAIWNTGVLKTGNQDWTSKGTWTFNTTVDDPITITVGTQALTAGFIEFVISYWISP